ncbi:MAG: ion transporter [archaeon]|nr:ion transporter [archaeon]
MSKKVQPNVKKNQNIKASPNETSKNEESLLSSLSSESEDIETKMEKMIKMRRAGETLEASKIEKKNQKEENKTGGGTKKEMNNFMTKSNFFKPSKQKEESKNISASAQSSKGFKKMSPSEMAKSTFFGQRNIINTGNERIRRALIKINDIFSSAKANMITDFFMRMRQIRFFKKKAKQNQAENVFYFFKQIIIYTYLKGPFKILYPQHQFTSRSSTKRYSIKRGKTSKRILKKESSDHLSPRINSPRDENKVEEDENEDLIDEDKKLQADELRKTQGFIPRKATQRKLTMKNAVKFNSETGNLNEENEMEENELEEAQQIISDMPPLRQAYNQSFEPEEIEEDDEENKEGDEEKKGEEGKTKKEDEGEKKEELIDENETLLKKKKDEEGEIIEYDKFYKEQFYKEEVFKIDAKMQDKEEEEIQAEIYKQKLKKEIKALQKIRDATALKKLPTEELDEKLEAMRKEYIHLKTYVDMSVNLQLNNTEKYLHRGKMLFNYFNEKGDSILPKFTVENVKDMKGKEIISFKELSTEEKIRRKYDRCPCLKCRRAIYKIFAYIRHYCKLIVDNFIFDNFSLLIIVTNTILILISDPRDANSLQNTTDSYFLYFYTVEAALKIISFGFIIGEQAYIKDYWNILDFFVIIMGWVSFILERVMEGKKIAGISGLRAFRILRPLKTVKSIKGLKRLVIALLGSISKLSDTAIVLFFFFLLFAVGGVQMWQGLFFRRCMSVNYGNFVSLDSWEGTCTFDSDCEEYNSMGDKYICAKGYRNPHSGIISFDNTLVGFVTVFIMATLEGWSEIFIFVTNTFKDKYYINPVIIFFYFHVFIFVGAFYLMNLFLAVTNNEFTNVERQRKENTSLKSFYKLIKSKYDVKEKEKIERKKKEKEQKLKTKKNQSDDALTELRYKIEDEAYEIEKNERDIPINYTTIKDMYIMQNNNPEELYSIKELIDEEEDFLKKDIKAQVKEINEQIKEQGGMTIKKEDKDDKKLKLNKTSTLKKEPTGNVENKSNKGSAGAGNFIIANYDKIENGLIEPSIIDTKSAMKEELNESDKAKPKKKVGEGLTALKQKLEKKEIEKKKLDQISFQEDLPFERILKEKEKAEQKKREVMKGIEEEKKKKNKKGQRKSSLVRKTIGASDNVNMIKEINKNKKYKDRIDAELSFMSDLSIGGEEIKQIGTNGSNSNIRIRTSTSCPGDILKNVEDGVEDEGEPIEEEKSLVSISKQKDSSVNKTFDSNSSILIDEDKAIERKIVFDEEEKLYSEVFLPKPSSFLPQMMKIKNDDQIQTKLEIMRNHFKVNDYLKKVTSSGIPVTSIQRRRSFLNFMQYIDEQENEEDLLKKMPLDDSKVSLSDIGLNESLFKEEQDVGVLSEISDASSKVHDEIPENEVVYDENMNADEIVKRIQLNQCTAYSRRAFLDRNSRGAQKDWNNEKLKKFYEQVNDFLNENVIVDSKEARGRGKNIDYNCSHLFINNNNKSDSIQKLNEAKDMEVKELPELYKEKASSLAQLKEKKDEYEKVEAEYNQKIDEMKDQHSKDNLKRFRSKSIDKSELKFTPPDTKELFVPEVNRKPNDILTPLQEEIPENLRTRRFYMNYMNNIIEKDIKVKDSFDIDTWKNEILGIKKKEIKKEKLPESIEAVFVFNDKSYNLKKYKYQYHKKFEFMENEYAVLTHNLKYLPINVLEITPLRIRDFGRYWVGKGINLGALGMGNASKSTFAGAQSGRSSGNNSTQINSKGKSSLCNASSYVNQKVINEELKFKKGFYEKVCKNLDEFNYLTLSHYFLNEESLQSKLLDENRRDQRDEEQEAKNKERDHILQVKKELRDIHLFDVKTGSSRYNEWSGYDVMYKADINQERDRYNGMIESIEEFGVVLWKKAPGVKQMQKIKYAFYLASINTYFDLFIMFLVLANAVVMALDGNLFSPEVYFKISYSNYAFNGIFIAEFVIKFIGLGPIVYFSDAFTYLDLVIIAFAILDMCTPSSAEDNEIGATKSIAAQLSFLRVFRIFRVLRLTKILRRLKSMRLIIVSIKKSLADVAYIVLILIMFLLIFQLLGMSLLNGNIRYQSFLYAFYSTFVVLTSENWNGIFYEVYPLSIFTFFYYLIWLFLGNYILFNLFVSILLQSFDDSGEDNEEDDDDEDIVERIVALPQYFQQLKDAEKENKNRMKKAKGADQQNIVQAKPGGGGASMTTSSRMNVSGNMSESKSRVSGASSSEAISDSGAAGSDEEVDEDGEAKGTTDLEKDIIFWRKVNYLFRKNECESSLYFLSQTNKFRILCMKTCTHRYFDRVILVMILLSTARLILDTIVAGYLSVLIFDIMDLFFNTIFFLEMLIKIIALGFVMDEGSYLRDNWNKIDLVIVAVSMFDVVSLVQKYIIKTSGGGSSLNFLKVLRLLRTLRPLRFISHNVQLKLIITSLFDSILPITNALLIVLVVFFMFSVVGINLFYSLYHNCYIPAGGGAFKLAAGDFADNLQGVNKDMPSIEQYCIDKYNGIMDSGPKFKFSNIFTSLITSYCLSTAEGWPDIMNDYRVFNDYYGIFFVVYILVVSYFFLNIFTGIMFKYFNDAWSRELNVSENDKKAGKYYDFIQQIEEADPEYVTSILPEQGSWRWYLYKVATSDFLDNFIMIIIFLNLIIMAINYDGTTEGYQSFLDTVNLIFTSIFIAECVLKIVALGIPLYFHYGWNQFDCFVVVASIVDLAIANVESINASFLKSFQIIRVLRVLRVTRVLRLVKSLKSLEKLIQTLSWSVGALGNVFILMFLIFCIFAILGCYLYESITYAEYKDKFVYLNKIYNFDNFYNAFLTTFRCATGEDWPSIMLELAFIDPKVVSEAQAYIYMIFMNFISVIILLNLFLMVTLQQYDEFTGKAKNPVEVFEMFMNEFKSAWNKYASAPDKGLRMKKHLVPNFLMDFNWKKLHFPEENKIANVKKYVSELKLLADNENYVYFHEVLYKIVFAQMGSKIDRTDPDNGVIFREEKKIVNAVNKTIKQYIADHEINKNQGKNPLNNFNPLTSHLYYRTSYIYIRTFIKTYKRKVDALMNDLSNSGSNSGDGLNQHSASGENGTGSGPDGTGSGSALENENINSGSKGSGEGEGSGGLGLLSTVRDKKDEGSGVQN